MAAILFLDDWKKYPNAIIDLKTKNQSALDLAAKFKAAGVKNHAFFLALYNPRLQGVDPHDPKLTQEQMFMVAIECRDNPWYFFREVARVPAIAGLSSVYVEINRANICLWWCFFNHVMLFLTQPRQTGKSFCSDLLDTGLMNFWCNNTQINLMTKDDRLRSDNIQRLKDIYDELPRYLNLKTRDDANNTEEISIKRMGNTYKTLVPPTSPKAAYNKGRGITTPIFKIDEAPFQQYIDISLPAALGSMGAAIDAAKRENAHYGIVFTTTAGKRDEKEGKFIYGMIQESAIWTEVFLDAKDEQELRQWVMRNSRSSRSKALPNDQENEGFSGVYQIYASFTHQHLGKDDNWLMQQLVRTKQKGEDANRDYFNIWTAGTESSPLPVHLTEAISQSKIASDHQSIAAVGGYILRWYIAENEIEDFMRERDVVVAVDTSDASGGDDIGMVFTDAKTGGVLAAGNFNETNLITFSKWLIHMIQAWPKTTWIIERRSSGITIIDYLLLMLPQLGIDPFKRLFNWVMNDPAEHKERHAEAIQPMSWRNEDTFTRAKRYFGFATSASGATSRTELYSTTLMNAAKRFGTRVHDQPLIQQIVGLVTKNGRVDHAEGEHDDLVIAWLLTQWFLTMAKNLNNYGIDPTKILVPIFEEEKATPQAKLQNQMQRLVRQSIENILVQMRSTSDPALLTRYEQQLRALERQLVLREGEHFSIDQVLNELYDNHSKRRRALQAQYGSLADHYDAHSRYNVDLTYQNLPEGCVLIT